MGKEKNRQRLFYPRLLLLYGGARFVIEFFRSTAKDWLYLSHAQWFSLAAIIIGAILKLY
ncbi:MAG: prolipoprotein diacylglyceryl transferase [Clostridia bacterium]|nr:prolipoprotein diacylglyceryl transferase [Clostridia bacterium]